MPMAPTVKRYHQHYWPKLNIVEKQTYSPLYISSISFLNAANILARTNFIV